MNFTTGVMRVKSFYRKREKKGYTLAEVLITVAILIILMAIAASGNLYHQEESETEGSG